MSKKTLLCPPPFFGGEALFRITLTTPSTVVCRDPLEALTMHRHLAKHSATIATQLQRQRPGNDQGVRQPERQQVRHFPLSIA